MATTGKLVEWLSAGVVTTAGVAVASGVVRFYQPGTLTPQTVYSDAAAASPITQPVVLSAGGVATVYAVQPVRMIVKDATDTTTLYDVTENVTRAEQVYVTSSSFNSGTETQLSTLLNNWSTTAGGSAGLFTYKRTGGTSERNLRDAIGESRVPVKDMGAVGDGVTNDTSAVQAALDRASAEGGGTVFFPPGTYLITSTLTLAANVSMEGVGSAVCIIKQSTAATNGITATTAGNNRIQGLQVTHSGTSTGVGVSFVTTTNVMLRDVAVAAGKFATGVKFDACSSTSVYDSSLACVSNAANRALFYTTSGANHTCFNTSLSGGAAGSCVEIATGASSILIAGCQFGAPGGTGVILTSSDNNDQIRVIANAGLANNVGTAFSETSPHSRGLFQVGNLIEGYETTVTSGGTFTPSPILRGEHIRVSGTTTGVAYVVAAPPTNPISRTARMVIEFFNNAGGAVTGWTLNAIYKVNGAISTTNLDKTTITFIWDAPTSVWREQSRVVTT